MKFKTKRTPFFLVGLLVAAMLCCLFMAVGIGASAADTLITDAPLTAGRSFEDGEGIQLGKNLDTMPRTYEAVVYVPSDVNEKGAIISNYYPLSNTPHIDFAIGIGGTESEARPMLDITDLNNNRTRIEFRSNIKGDSWVHVVITHESNSAGDVYTCYVNGEKVAKKNVNYWVDGVKDSGANIAYGELDMAKMEQSASMYLGQAYAYSSVTELGADDPYNDEGEAYQPTNFKGRIKNVALYSTVLSEAEIKANYQSGIDASSDSIILCYDLTSEQTSKETKSGYISDISGNGYNTVPLFHEREEELSGDEFDYAFAVLGDTQFLVDRDVSEGTSYTADIYNWIIANKDSKKIARVLGVGDIVEAGKIAGEFDENTDESSSDLSESDKTAIKQWKYAAMQFARLEEAGISYSITWGYNHDGLYGKEFTTYFGNSTNFTDSDIGYYFSDSSSENYGKRLSNYYQKFEVEGVKYMIMCIEFMPSYDVLDWADRAIDANHDHRVIITTHYYIDQYGEIPDDQEKASGNDDRIRADVLAAKWEMLANENENVEMILCGHVARQNNIVQRYTVAKSGQKVAQLLIDPQQMDRFYGYDDTGVVVMLYFSNRGNDVRVELVSTSRTMRAREAAEAEGRDADEVNDILYGKKNEFSYSLLDSKAPVTTEYGVIPEEFSSADEYPFVVFDNNKKFVGASKYLNGINDGSYDKDANAAIGIAKTHLKTNTWMNGSWGDNEISVTILMRDNVTMDSTESYGNIAQAKGSITIDFGGYVLTAPQSKNLFDLSYKAAPSSYGQTIFDTTLNVKNGEIVIQDKYAVNFSTNDSGAGKRYHCKFENVKFTVIGTTKKIVNASGSNHSFDPDVEFYNCDFDLSNASNTVTIFDLGTTVSVDYMVIGGKITTSKANYKISNAPTDTRGSLTLKANADKQYISIVLPSGVSVTTETFHGGSLYFKKSGGTDEITYKLYTNLGKYGEILADDTEYAFLIFDGSNKLKYKSDELYGAAASTSAVHLAKEEILKNNRWVLQADGTYAYEGKNSGDAPITCTILMMRDYTMGEYESYNNLSQIQGILTIDLNGYTLSANESKCLFSTSLKKWTSSGDAEIFPSQITLKNGKIDVYNHAIISFANNTNGNGKEFTYRFEDVMIFAKGTASSIIVDQPGTSSVTYKTALELVNCNIDISGSSAEGAVTLFNLGNKTTNTDTRVYGGSIVSGNKEFKLWEQASGSGTVVFYKSEGSYTVMSSNGFVPKESVMTEDGLLCVFVKESATADAVMFVLYPEIMVGYKIKTSVTLYSNFVYNLYIPKANVDSFTVNGKTVDYEEVEIDGVTYYHVAVNLAAAESLSNIKVTVTLNSGNTTVDANWTLNVLNYTKSVINGNYDDTTKLLMKDMLVYASAAHTYFNNPLDTTKANVVTTLLDGYTAELPTGDAKLPASDTYFTSATVYLGEVPSFRFYLAEGYTADDFTCKVGKRSVTATTGSDENGAYLEVVMYAYMMLDDVTYTVTDKTTNETVTESYNLYAYYNYAKSLNNDKLTAIVEGLMKYAVSAAKYRASVIGA